MRVLVLLIIALMAISSANSVPSAPTVTLRESGETYEVVEPRVLREKRSARNAQPESLDIQISTASGETFTLQLTLNDKLISPQFVSSYFAEDGNEVETVGHINCYYQGKVLEHPGWMAAIESCQGLRGSFGNLNNPSQIYNVEPLSLNDYSLEQRHTLFLADGIKDGSCGVGDHSRSRRSSNPLGLSDEELDRAQRSVNQYFVELYIVSDYSQYINSGRSVSETVNRALSIVNIADLLYTPLKIRLVVKHTETWNIFDRMEVSTNMSTTLYDFTIYVSSMQSSDASVLISGILGFGDILGVAYVGTMCSVYSTAVVNDIFRNVAIAGFTFAHEVGHLFDMEHDTPSCSCRGPSCIMNATLSLNIFWSSCSISGLKSSLAHPYHSTGRCLLNEPSQLIAVCGNGIREGNEVCDCGSIKECNNPCCDAATCQAKTWAECTRGACCSGDCKIMPKNNICRHASGECDIDDYCSGKSAECPEDLYLQDGTSCNDSQAYCYSGACKTRDAQCQLHYATDKGIDFCYSGNKEGSRFGNCGDNGTHYIQCSDEDIMCGMLFCKPDGQFQNVVHAQESIFHSLGIILCRGFTYVGLHDIVDPGLVEDGIKCGSDKLCVQQKCVNITSLGHTQCPIGPNGRICSGNGKCNNKDSCSCDFGWTGSACNRCEKNTLYVQAFTSGVPFGYSNEHHSLFFSLKSGENVTLPFYNRPEDDMQAHKGDLWVFDFSTTDLPCFDYHDVDKVVLVENSNDGWHIESVTTILSIKGLHHKSWALLTVDLDANFWIDGNAGDDRKKHELTRVKLFPSRRPPGPLSTPP